MPKAKERKSSSTRRRISKKISWKTSSHHDPVNGRRRSRKRSKDILRWSDVAPISKSSRRKMMPNCFLDEKNRKYPICPKRVKQVTCQGLVAARARAVINGDEYIVTKADNKKDVLMCDNTYHSIRDARIIAKSLKRSSRSNTERRQRRKSHDVKKTMSKASKNKKTISPPRLLHHLTNVGKQINHHTSKTTATDF